MTRAIYVNAQFKGFSFIDPHLTMCRVSALNPGEFLSRSEGGEAHRTGNYNKSS